MGFVSKLFSSGKVGFFTLKFVFTSLRFKEHNLLMMALWVGSGHPNMNRFLTPLVNQLRVLESPTKVLTSSEDLNL